MKTLLAILFFFISLKGFCQFPITLKGNDPVQETLDFGARGAKGGFVWASNITDTTTANSQIYLKGTPGIVILVNESQLWIRNQTATAWVQVGGGASSARNGLTVNGGFVELGGLMTKSDTIFTGTPSNFPLVISTLAGSPQSTLTIDFNSAGGGNEGIVKLDARGFAGTGFSYLGSDPGNVKYFVNNFNTPALSASSGINYGNTLAGFQGKLNNANIISQFVLGAGQNFFCDSCLMIRATGAGVDIAADGVGGGRIGFRGSASNNTSWYGAFLGGTNSHFILGSTLTDVGGKKLIVYGSSYFQDSVTIGSTNPIAKFNVLSTTEQIRIQYDASNYYSTTVGSTGGVTFDAVGSGSAFTFSDGITINGNLTLGTAGNKLNITTGSNASMGVSSAMTAGSITISTTAVTTNSRIFLTHATVGGTTGVLTVGTIVNGTSFVINSSNGADTGTVNWWIVN